MISKAFGAAVAGVVLGPWAASSRIVTGRPRNPVGFQNSAKAADQRFQATDTDGLSKPPRIGRRRILPRTGSGTGASGRGGLVMDLGGISRDAGSSFATGRAVHCHTQAGGQIGMGEARKFRRSGLTAATARMAPISASTCGCR